MVYSLFTIFYQSINMKSCVLNLLNSYTFFLKDDFHLDDPVICNDRITFFFFLKIVLHCYLLTFLITHWYT